MKITKLVIAFAIATLLLSSSTTSYACLCSIVSVKKRVKQMKKEANAIFVGRVKSVSRENEPMTQPTIYRVVLIVSQSWKSDDNMEYTIYTTGGCALSFKENDDYLVYAETDESGHLTTDVCMGTRPLELAGKDLKHLGKPVSIMKK